MTAEYREDKLGYNCNEKQIAPTKAALQTKTKCEQTQAVQWLSSPSLPAVLFYSVCCFCLHRGGDSSRHPKEVIISMLHSQSQFDGLGWVWLSSDHVSWNFWCMKGEHQGIIMTHFVLKIEFHSLTESLSFGSGFMDWTLSSRSFGRSVHWICIAMTTWNPAMDSSPPLE